MIKLSYFGIAPKAMDGTLMNGKYLAQSTLEQRLLDLVNIRASQINGCAFCLELHHREAKDDGESDLRLATIAAWRDTTFFSDRERAALLWTERITLITSKELSDHEEQLVRSQFSDKELVDLTLAIATINTFNRFNVAFHTEPNPSFRTRTPQPA